MSNIRKFYNLKRREYYFSFVNMLRMSRLYNIKIYARLVSTIAKMQPRPAASTTSVQALYRDRPAM